MSPGCFRNRAGHSGGLAEGPVGVDEGLELGLDRGLGDGDRAPWLFDLDEEDGLDAALAHRVVQRAEDVGGVLEAVAGEDDAGFGALEEVAEDDGGVAGGRLGALGAGPDELGRRALVLGALGEDSVEDREAGLARVAAQGRGEGVELLAQAEGDQLVARERGAQAVVSQGGAQALEAGGADAGEAAAHGRSPKKASAGSLPIVGTTRARSRKRLKRSHEHSAT